MPRTAGVLLALATPLKLALFIVDHQLDLLYCGVYERSTTECCMQFHSCWRIMLSNYGKYMRHLDHPKSDAMVFFGQYY